jgi:hypothetical protein
MGRPTTMYGKVTEIVSLCNSYLFVMVLFLNDQRESLLSFIDWLI